MRIQVGDMSSGSARTRIDRHAVVAAGQLLDIGDLVGASRSALLDPSRHVAKPASIG